MFKFSDYSPEVIKELSANDKEFRNLTIGQRNILIRAWIEGEDGDVQVRGTATGTWVKFPKTGAIRHWDVYRLNPERCKPKKPEFNDVPIQPDGSFRVPQKGGPTLNWWSDRVAALPGYRGIVYEWRGWRWVESGAFIHILAETKMAEHPWYAKWLSDPTVEAPTPVAVRFVSDN